MTQLSEAEARASRRRLVDLIRYTDRIVTSAPVGALWVCPTCGAHAGAPCKPTMGLDPTKALHAARRALGHWVMSQHEEIVFSVDLEFTTREGYLRAVERLTSSPLHDRMVWAFCEMTADAAIADAKRGLR